MRRRVGLVALIGVGMAALTGGESEAAVIVHFNPAPGEPGHFDWSVPTLGDEVILSVLHAASDQNAMLGDSGAYRQRHLLSDGSVDVRRAGALGEGPLSFFAPSGLALHLVGFELGNMIEGTAGDGIRSSAAVINFSPSPGDQMTYLPIGPEFFVGVAFDQGAGTQFGWIGVTFDGLDLDAFAWGYETEPDVPIAAGAGIPSPGAAALLGLTGLAACRRRRRGASGAAGARLSRRGSVAAPLAAVAMAVVAVPAADAAIVVHLNPAPGEPGHFEWSGGVGPNAWVWLDIALPAASQAGLFSSSSVGQNFDPDAGVSAVTGDSQVSIDPSFFAIGHELGEPIDASLTWDGAGVITWPDLGPPAIPEGEERYVGVRFDVGSGDQFGWIGVVRTGVDLNAFAWGYETEPGVPIAAGAGIPSPGAAVMLPLGALAVLRRRR